MAENKKNSITDEELEAELATVRAHRSELEEKIEKIFSELRMTRSELTDYLNNPQNFNEQEWKIVQAERDVLLDNIWRHVGDEYKRAYQEKRIKKAEKDRKRKGISSRKNWIPMQ